MSKSVDAFRTISEVAKELGLATHVLRFWESKFPQIKPLKRAGGRRYYRPDDVALIRRLQTLLHDEGYTIKGVQKLFREEGARKFIDEGMSEAIDAPSDALDASVRPQASLFDAAPVAEAAPMPIAEHIQEKPIQYSPDLLPSAPEPEPILDPSEPSVIVRTETVIKQTLSEEQKEILNSVLAELQEMKTQIDNVA